MDIYNVMFPEAFGAEVEEFEAAIRADANAQADAQAAESLIKSLGVSPDEAFRMVFEVNTRLKAIAG